MTKIQRERRRRLLPKGEPHYVRIYDNHDTDPTFDRYTVIFSGRYRQYTHGEFLLLAMSINPYHPQGFCIHSTYPYQCDTLGAPDKDGRRRRTRWGGVSVGRTCHLGRRIEFKDLPEQCRMSVLQTYMPLWGLTNESSPSCAAIAVDLLAHDKVRYEFWLGDDA